MHEVPFNRRLSFAGLLSFVSLFAISCGFIRTGVEYKWGFLTFLGASMLASLVGGLLAFLTVGRCGIVSGMIIGWLLLVFVGLLGLPWEDWF